MRTIIYKETFTVRNLQRFTFSIILLYVISIFFIKVLKYESNMLSGTLTSVFNGQSNLPAKPISASALCQPTMINNVITARPQLSPISIPAGSSALSGVRKWTNGTNWFGGQKPGSNDDVLIPANSAMLLNQDINVNSITIEGKLIVDITQDISITAKHIIIRGESGYFEMGTPNERYEKNGEIRLLGDRVEKIPGTDTESKAIMVMSGSVLEIHGKRKRAWTHLDGNIEAGATRIRLAQPVSNWNVGDEIVIASSSYNSEGFDVAKITNIGGARSTVVDLEKGLEHPHYGQIDLYKDGTKSYDQRAEVGLLSRNIKITGIMRNNTANRYGGHIMIMRGGTAHVQGVELDNMGQEGILGRYPFHWHICGDVPGQYIRSSAIKNSFNRAVTIHGSNRALVADNVAFNFRGHGYFLEDGDEEFNIIDHNLAIAGRNASRGKGLIPQDENNASAFWITNLNNTFTNNSASSVRQGFWIVPLTKVLRQGASLSKGGNPRDYSLLEFDGNVAHTTQIGLRIDGDLKPDGSFQDLSALGPKEDVNGNRLTYAINNLTVYKTNNAGIWTRVAALERYTNSVFGDAKLMAFLAFNGVIENSLFVADSKNRRSSNDYKPNREILGLQMYNGGSDFKDIHLAGFTRSKTVAVGNRMSSGKHPNFAASGITFEKDGTDEQKINMGYFGNAEDPSRSYHFVAGMIDRDGSLTGIEGSRIAPKIFNTQYELNDRDDYQYRIFDPLFNQPRDASKRIELPESYSSVASVDTDFALLFNESGVKPGPEDNRTTEFIYGIRSDGPIVFDRFRKNSDTQWPVITNDKEIIYYYQRHKLNNNMHSSLRWARKRNTSIIVGYTNIPSEHYILNTKKVNSLEELRRINDQNAYFYKDHTMYIKYVTTKNVDGEINTSVTFPDYSSNTVKFGATEGDIKKIPYVTLADFEGGSDDRVRVKKSSGAGGVISIGSVDVDDNNPRNEKDGRLTFILKRNGAAPDKSFVDLDIDLTSDQVWREFKTLSLQFSGIPFRLYTRDSDNGYKFLGGYTANNRKRTINIDLRQLNPNKADAVNKLKFRFSGKDIPTQNTRISLYRAILSVDISNDYEKNPFEGCEEIDEETDCGSTLSVTDHTDLDDFQVYPNPIINESTLQITNNKEAPFTVRVYDISGKLITESYQNSDIKTLSTDQWAKGAYFIKIQSDQLQKTMKVIKN